MDLTRRDFLIKGSAALFIASIAGPLGLWEWNQVQRGRASVNRPILVVVQMSGGNDGLNTVIPYANGVYYDSRPSLAIGQDEVLRIDSALGLHPSLNGLKQLYDRGKLAIVNGVGYPNPNRSHFRSMEIWQTAVPDKNADTGWLGRYLDATQSGTGNLVAGLTVGTPAKIFLSKQIDAPVIESVANFRLKVRGAREEQRRRLEAFRQMYGTAEIPALQVVAEKGMHALQASELIETHASEPKPGVKYPASSKFADHLQLIAELMGSGLATSVYFTQIGGFDDHAREKADHARLLQEFDQGISAFYADLENRGLADRAVVLMYSEFGRRLKENASGGTDHGTAGPVFVLGEKVKGGMYGEMPRLSDLDENGNLKYRLDFRSLYSTVLEDWMRAPAQEIVGGNFERLPLI